MRSMWVVFSKEFLDIIRDRRRFILTLLTLFVFLPLILIVPYSYILTRTFQQSLDVVVVPVQGMDRAPALIAYLAEEKDMKAVAVDDVEILVKDKQYVAGLIIPEEYEEGLSSGHSVEVVLVSDRSRSMDAVSARLMGALEEYNMELTKTRLQELGMAEDFITPLTVKQQNVATATETTGSKLGFFIPAIILGFGLSTGMPIAIAAIAGEKKKLTLEPVLFTTVGRFQLVIAKLLAVLVSIFMTLLSMGISFSIVGAGTLFIVARNVSLEKIASSAAGGAAEPSASSSLMDVYHIEPLAVLLLLIAPFLIILLGAALQILISTWARNDEEATTYLMPVSLVSGGIIMLPFFLDDITVRLWHYAIPVFGTILSMRDLFSNKVDPASLTVMFGTSALYAFLMIVLAVWMFQREEVVFRT